MHNDDYHDILLSFLPKRTSSINKYALFVVGLKLFVCGYVRMPGKALLWDNSACFSAVVVILATFISELPRNRMMCKDNVSEKQNMQNNLPLCFPSMTPGSHSKIEAKLGCYCLGWGGVRKHTSILNNEPHLQRMLCPHILYLMFLATNVPR